MKRILYTNDGGGLSIIIPSGAVEDSVKDVPENTAYEIVNTADVPPDRIFRNAWEHDATSAPEKVRTNMAKAKGVAHIARRAARAALFAPLDIEATIPSKSTASETKRQTVRDDDALKQIAIDAASTEQELKAAM